MRWNQLFCLFATCIISSASQAGVVINEIFYNAPDDQDDIQWIELYNSSDQQADLNNWSINHGKYFAFSQSTILEPKGYIVIALNPDVFKKTYTVPAIGSLKSSLSKKKDIIELYDDKNNLVDTVPYKSKEPWPVSPDGYSASLERICPNEPGDIPQNWASSPLPTDIPKPAGSPGKQNTGFSATLPPVITKLQTSADDPLIGETIRVEADVIDKNSLQEVNLLFRIANPGSESKETAVPMIKESTGDCYTADIPAQATNAIVRYRIKAVNKNGVQRMYPAENDLCPMLSLYVHEKWNTVKVPFGFVLHVAKDPKAIAADAKKRNNRSFGGMGGFFGFGFGQNTQKPNPPRGTSAFVYVDEKTGKTSIYDFINIADRFGNRGCRVFFHKEQMLNEMASINLINEGNERFLFAEALSYDVYNRAGVPAPQTKFVRLWVDGNLVGYHLLAERPNRSFLRRNDTDDNGDLFKIRWMGRDIYDKYEKKTNPQTGHDNLLDILDQLQKSQGEEQWKIIQDNFNINETASFFAVNMILSHWDGFFNNHFLYHDIKNTGKWEFYPWDHDKTWGYYDGMPENEVFFNMPLNFGMEGAQPPAGLNSRPGRGFPPPPGGFSPPPGGPGFPPPGMRDRNPAGPGINRPTAMIDDDDEDFPPPPPGMEDGFPDGPPPDMQGGRPAVPGINPPTDARGGRPGQGFPPGPGFPPPGGMRDDHHGPGGFGGFGGFGGPFGGGAPWWRDGGEFSKPLLANPQFRSIFLKRVKEILETIYTKDTYFPLIDQMADTIKEDTMLLAKLYGEDPASGAGFLEKNVKSFRDHLQKRREFLLEQKEIQSLNQPQDKKEPAEKK